MPQITFCCCMPLRLNILSSIYAGLLKILKLCKWWTVYQCSCILWLDLFVGQPWLGKDKGLSRACRWPLFLTKTARGETKSIISDKCFIQDMTIMKICNFNNPFALKFCITSLYIDHGAISYRLRYNLRKLIILLSGGGSLADWERNNKAFSPYSFKIEEAWFKTYGTFLPISKWWQTFESCKRGKLESA